MKLIILALFFCWKFEGTESAVHLNCFGHVCDGHKSTCLVHKDHEMTGRCEDHHVCDNHFLCTEHHQEHEHGPMGECCCKDQQCIDGLHATVHTNHITCFGHTCGFHDSICVVNKDRHHVEGWCEAPEHCHHRSLCTASHTSVHGPGPAHECCCLDQNCVDSITTTGSSTQQSGNFLTCMGNTCDEHRPYCHLHGTSDHLEGHCTEELKCMEHHRGICRSLSDTHGREGCCCQHDTCITAITGVHHANNNHTTNTNGIYSNGLQCSECSDLAAQTCVHDHLSCGVNEVCEITHKPQGAVSTRCQSIMQCAMDKFAEASVPNQGTTLCCGSDHCTTNALHNITTTGGHLTCPVCKNQFLGDCQGDHICASGESCMFEVQHGLLATRCSPNCHSQGPQTVCCHDNYCVATTTQHFHQASFVCPRCRDQPMDICLANTITCTGDNAGCSIVRTQNGFTAGCSNSIQDCMTVASTNSAACALSSPLDNTTQCQACCQKDDADCIRQSLSVHGTNMPTTGAPLMPSTVVGTPKPTQDSTTAMPATIAPAIQTSPIVQTPKPTQGAPSTVAPVVTSTPKVCVDNDPQSCQALQASLCTATDQNIHHLAIVTCAKSCGFCDEYLQITPSTAAPPVTTPTPTTPKMCVDVDPANCKRLGATLCSATDPNIHHMAVTTCAKTCDFCDEFIVV